MLYSPENMNIKTLINRQCSNKLKDFVHEHNGISIDLFQEESNKRCLMLVNAYSLKIQSDFKQYSTNAKICIGKVGRKIKNIYLGVNTTIMKLAQTLIALVLSSSKRQPAVPTFAFSEVQIPLSISFPTEYGYVSLDTGTLFSLPKIMLTLIFMIKTE